MSSLASGSEIQRPCSYAAACAPRSVQSFTLLLQPRRSGCDPCFAQTGRSVVYPRRSPTGFLILLVLVGRLYCSSPFDFSTDLLSLSLKQLEDRDHTGGATEAASQL
jgi:hypothetical protein